MNKNAWQYSKLDKSVIDRFKKLGDIGESIAVTLLQNAGFTNVENLNSSLRKNIQYFDIQAHRDRRRYVISIKTRNKYENSAAGVKINSRYKLYDDPVAVLMEAKAIYNSEAAWVTVAMDVSKGTVDAYFGTIETLAGNKKGVPMSDKSTKSYEALALCCPIERFGIERETYEKLANIYQKRNSGRSV